MDLELIDSLPFLQGLTSDEKHLFAALAEIRDVPARTCIIEEGGPIDAFYIVVEGTVHVRRKARIREMLLGRIARGGFFGEINLFDPGCATASIHAMGPVKLAVIDYAALRGYMEMHPSAGYRIVTALMTELARRLRQTNERLVSSVYWRPAAPGPAGASEV